MRTPYSMETKFPLKHILYDFKADLYGKYVKVELLEFKRPERKFSGLSELKKQIAKDIADCR